MMVLGMSFVSTTASLEEIPAISFRVGKWLLKYTHDEYQHSVLTFRLDQVRLCRFRLREIMTG